MVLDPLPQTLPVHFFGSRPQPPTSPCDLRFQAFFCWKNLEYGLTAKKFGSVSVCVSVRVSVRVRMCVLIASSVCVCVCRCSCASSVCVSVSVCVRSIYVCIYVCCEKDCLHACLSCHTHEQVMSQITKDTQDEK